MDARTFFALSAGFAAAAAFSGWRGALPPNPFKGPRLVPWRALMLVGATAAVLCLTLAAEAAGLIR
ncbi:hypothetical protein [Phenylobacterium sp. SCN 70-31]|uniref:hypothetical protein n=1 Tax=Phenylobacterium sp. SCN 70-31 TaxID=1660129 RepID=UPI00086CC51D|nr:hypothetical protein [Phenylobacterium sp. SCN 70-31]ODT85979.1 MAG: hypothetical protein ABS78_17790 [Phenylobacterium sp. SCN 70-31]